MNLFAEHMKNKQEKRVDFDGIEMAESLYGKPKKKRKKRFKRKPKDAEIRPEMVWSNRKTKSQKNGQTKS